MKSLHTRHVRKCQRIFIVKNCVKISEGRLDCYSHVAFDMLKMKQKQRVYVKQQRNKGKQNNTVPIFILD